MCRNSFVCVQRQWELCFVWCIVLVKFDVQFNTRLKPPMKWCVMFGLRLVRSLKTLQKSAFILETLWLSSGRSSQRKMSGQIELIKQNSMVLITSPSSPLFYFLSVEAKLVFLLELWNRAKFWVVMIAIPEEGEWRNTYRYFQSCQGHWWTRFCHA